ncbi:MAG: hypothetical protein Phog2KO_37350 [Phototrophicaceae bacterium]
MLSVIFNLTNLQNGVLKKYNYQTHFVNRAKVYGETIVILSMLNKVTFIIQGISIDSSLSVIQQIQSDCLDSQQSHTKLNLMATHEAYWRYSL